MLHLIKTFEKDNTVYFECLYRDIDGTPTDPTNPTWKILDAKGSTVASGSPSKRATGIWYCFWTPLLVGDHVLIFEGTIDDNAITIRKLLKVVETRIK